MKFEDFSKEQQHAITVDGTNVLVSAGAGSGKTEVLTARVIHFIKEKKYKLNQFLILTFTNLAAAEMKERIRKGLTEQGLEAAEEVDSASICTFDSYALNLVKRYHFMLNVSPRASIVDSTIIAVKERAILDEIFERLYKERDPEFTEMIKHFCIKTDKDIRKLVLKFYQKAILEDDTTAYLKSYERNFYSTEIFEKYACEITTKLQRMSDKLRKLINEIPNTVASKNDDGMPLANFANDIFSNFFKANDYDSLISSWNNIDSKDFKSIPKSSKNWSEETSEKVDLFTKTLERIKDLISTLPLTKADLFADLEETKSYSSVLVRIVLELDQRITDYKNSKGAYEFADIAKMAFKLIAEHENIRESIKSSLKMIMIDEYQDTSSFQDNFISMISDNNVYMVGDVKQSIYRFRNAEVAIFIDKYRSYKTLKVGEVIDLNDNFRSRKEVLDDINWVFSGLMSEERGGADYKKEHVIKSGNKEYPLFKGSSGHTNILLYSLDDGEKFDSKIEAEIIARDIIKKMNEGYLVLDHDKDKKPFLRPVQFKDFCILMDRGTAFEEYQEVFNDYQLPIYVENNEDISNKDMVLVLTNILRMINFISEDNFANPYFEKTWLSLARSFLFAYDDQKIYDLFKKKNLEHEAITAKIREIILENSSASFYELFENLVFDLDIYGKCIQLGDIENNHKYLNYFLTMFKSMSDLDYSLSDFISFMENVEEYKLKIELASTGTSVDSVRIMNIHKSKGLEFGVVYLSGVSREFNKMDVNESYNMTPKYGLIMPKDPHKANVLKILNSENEKKESTSERIRQLYVALTRAKEQLIIPIQIKDKIFFLEEPVEGNLSVKIPALTKDNEEFASFHEMLVSYLDCPDFVLTKVDRNGEKPEITKNEPPIDHLDLKAEDLNIDCKVIELNKASKQLALSASRKNLDFGTELHFLLETLDFVNPDYSSLSDEEKDVVANFLGSPLMKDVKLGKVYKEYEFFDESKGINGIIDLMIVYNDHIDIIDYKTKNIDDASYDKQVNIYMDFVSKAFGKEVKGYLYSLLDKNFRTVEKTIL